MPQFKCVCGNVFSLITIPNQQESRLIRNAEFEHIAERFMGSCDDTNVIFEALSDVANSVTECPECKRLHVCTSKRGAAPRYTVYAPEQEAKGLPD